MAVSVCVKSLAFAALELCFCDVYLFCFHQSNLLDGGESRRSECAKVNGVNVSRSME